VRFASTLTAPLVGLVLAACGSKPPPAPPPPTTEPASTAAPEPEPADEPEQSASGANIDTFEKSRAPSTATYEQAMSTPEHLDVHDDRPHLNDDQLRGPMRGVISGCPLPANAKVTIRTAVQSGRAIGVTVDVRFEHPPPKPPPKRQSRAAAQQAARAAQQAAQREAKAKKRIATCIDRAVRAIVWPPSGRRDSFTTDF
jgi:hypothetical protein